MSFCFGSASILNQHSAVLRDCMASPPMCMFLCSSCCSILLQWRGCWAQKQRLRCWSNRSSNTNELSDVYICTMVIETVMQTLSRCVLLMVNKSPCPENYFKNLISEQIFLQITKYKHIFFWLCDTLMSTLFVWCCVALCLALLWQHCAACTK